MNFEYDVVGKIGSMALIRKEDNDIDYNIFSRLSAELRPGMIWVNMSTLDKIIYIADYIEPGRRQAPGLPEVRQLADRKSTRLNSSHSAKSRMPSSA